MQLTNCSNYQEMSQIAAHLVEDAIRKNPKLLLCAATGNSPAGLYGELGRTALKDPGIFRQLRIIKLDEWSGVPEMHPVTCEHFITTWLLEPLQVARDRYITFPSDAGKPEKECERIHSTLEEEGPIDLCILGLGRNGHLGLNEPAPILEPHCHLASLSPESLKHEMIASLDPKPQFGITLGMEEILAARKIIFLVSGKGKAEIIQKLMEKKVSTDLPASFLWEHPHTECLLDNSCLD